MWILADMGAAQLNFRRFEESLKHYDRAIRLKPSPSVVTARANAYLRMGHPQKAMTDCDRVIDSGLDAGLPGIAKVLARAHALRAEAQLRSGEFDDAVRDFERSLQLDQSCAYEARVARAVAYYSLDDRAAAAADLNEVIEHATEHTPNSEKLVFAKAMQDFLSGRMPEAAAGLSHVVDVPVLDQYAIVLRADAWLGIGGRGEHAAFNDADELLKRWGNEPFAKTRARTIYRRLADSDDNDLAANAQARLERLDRD